jgi:hypothetical protein
MYTQSASFMRLYYRAVCLEARGLPLLHEIDKEVESLLALSDEELITASLHELPAISKRVIRCLETGESYTPPRFAALVTLVQGTTGRMQGECLALLRQVCEWAYKVDLPHSPEAVAAVFNVFIETEEDLADLVIDGEDPTLRLARRICHELMPATLPSATGRHGTGAVADGIKPHRRWRSALTVTPELESLMGFSETWGTESTVITEAYESKTACVPKDARGPRLICMEPFSLMFHQQPLAIWFKKFFRRFDFGESLNFEDQTRNQELARRASLSGEGRLELATLDLKEASDRVSMKLVKFLLPDHWFVLLSALRSNSTKILHPDGAIQRPLLKFAPMGSALCFPVEMLCFFCLACAATTRALRLSRWQHAAARLSVYGDDVIVPTQAADAVVMAFESVGLKVNLDKSFVKGPFRESCGADWLDGFDVTPVRWRRHHDRATAVYLESTVEFSNNLYRKGYWALAGAVRQWVHELGFELAYEHPDHRNGIAFESFFGPAFYLFRGGRPTYRWNSRLHTFAFPTVTVVKSKVTTCSSQEANYRQWHHQSGDAGCPVLRLLKGQQAYQPVGVFDVPLLDTELRIGRRQAVPPVGELSSLLTRLASVKAREKHVKPVKSRRSLRKARVRSS